MSACSFRGRRGGLPRCPPLTGRHGVEGGFGQLAPAERAVWYQRLPVGEVWGIGGRTAEKLARLGIEGIADFANADPRAMRDLLMVVGGRVQAELRGTSCLPMQMMVATRKGLACTRAFGRPVTSWDEMREAVTVYAHQAAGKLRAEDLEACYLAVFMHTDRHAQGERYQHLQHAARIEPTSDSRNLIAEAVRMAEGLWRDGLRYAKAGVVLNDLQPAGRQARIFATREAVGLGAHHGGDGGNQPPAWHRYGAAGGNWHRASEGVLMRPLPVADQHLASLLRLAADAVGGFHGLDVEAPEHLPHAWCVVEAQQEAPLDTSELLG